MKKICLALALSFAVATPAFACPHSEGEAKTAKTEGKDAKEAKKADKAESKGTAQKPAAAPKKADDKVSMK